MKILLTSDIHGNREAKEKIVELNPGMDLYLDAGDSQMEPRDMVPFVSVKGNCDYCNDFLPEFIFTTPYGKLFINHYPSIPQRILLDESITIIINGHTHVPSIRKINGVYFLNPGSVTYPRSTDHGTYMILNVTVDNIEVTLKDLS